MHKPLANAILGIFHLQPAEECLLALRSFPLSAWQDTYRWLDASGLALYLLDRVKCLHLEATLPASVLQRLEGNLSDNRDKTADTFSEFVRLNRAFIAAGVTFANLKGISLVPHACVDPALRLQLDLDFLIEMRQVQACSVALSAMGYILTGVSGSVWEFKAEASSVPSIIDLYKAKPQRSVEIHFDSKKQSHNLSARREWAVWEGFSFPTLNDADRFIAQAEHLLRHIRGEWTRLSWLLEFRQSVLFWKSDSAFWEQVRERAVLDRDLQAAIGTAIVLATTAFGSFAPEDLVAWAVDTLDPRMRLWLDRYGSEAIMANFPGTKLYLLLPPSISPGTMGRKAANHKKLLPLHKAPRVVHGAGEHGFGSYLRGWSAQITFVLFRLRFHLTEGWRYLQEAPRWRKIVASSQQPRTSLVAASERSLL